MYVARRRRTQESAGAIWGSQIAWMVRCVLLSLPLSQGLLVSVTSGQGMVLKDANLDARGAPCFKTPLACRAAVIHADTLDGHRLEPCPSEPPPEV